MIRTWVQQPVYLQVLMYVKFMAYHEPGRPCKSRTLKQVYKTNL